MHYDFDTVTDRSGTYSYKWDIGEGELPMWVADMDFKTAPEITEAFIERARHGVFGYSTVPPEWSAAYRSWWRDRHGIDYADDMFIFSTGVIPIISSCVRKLTTPGENVVIMTPVYNVFFNCIRNNGRKVLEVPLRYKDGEYSADMPALEAALADPQTTMLLLCNPQNPAGKIWDKQTLARIGQAMYPLPRPRRNALTTAWYAYPRPRPSILQAYRRRRRRYRTSVSGTRYGVR